jgi:hypothetical protein
LLPHVVRRSTRLPGSGGPSAAIAAAITARLRSIAAFGTRAFGRPPSRTSRLEVAEVEVAVLHVSLARLANGGRHARNGTPRRGSGLARHRRPPSAIAGILQGLAEAINFAEHAGLDVDQLVSVISKGAAQSWQMENRASTMARREFDFGFAVEWMRKDLGIALAEAGSNGARVPLTALVDQFYAQVADRGGRRWDTSSLINLLQQP